jgi:hypothetical protein
VTADKKELILVQVSPKLKSHSVLLFVQTPPPYEPNDGSKKGISSILFPIASVNFPAHPTPQAGPEIALPLLIVLVLVDP